MTRLRNYRVLHGVTGAAGQPWMLSQALTENGIDSRSVILGDSKLGYPSDYIIKSTPNDLTSVAEFLKDHHDEFDIFHLHFRPYFYVNSRKLEFPTFYDLVLLKAAGKRIVFHFRGSEVRLKSEFAEKSPYNYLASNPSRLSDKFPDHTIRRYIKTVNALADRVLVNDSEIQSYVGGGTIINRVPDESRLPNVGVSDRDIPLVIHAPSRRGVKGTDSVLKAVDELKAEGLLFDFELIEGYSHDEAIKRYKEADIIVDQLRIGWYGVLSVEGMCLGKAVACYIREDLISALGDTNPIANANPDTIKDVLRGLIADKEARIAQGLRGRKWFEMSHEKNVVVENLIEVYDDVIKNPKPIDFNTMIDFVIDQKKLANWLLVKTSRKQKGRHGLDGWYPQKLYSKASYVLETQGTRAFLWRSLLYLIGRKL